jgi:hypothetical protein
MSRSISIRYIDANGQDHDIEVGEYRELLGGQRSSMTFWSIPEIKQAGIERLSELGVTDPVIFYGWEDMALLAREIELLNKHLPNIDYDVKTKAYTLSQLIYCYQLLVGTAPRDSTPSLMIG